MVKYFTIVEWQKQRKHFEVVIKHGHEDEVDKRTKELIDIGYCPQQVRSLVRVVRVKNKIKKDVDN